MYSLSSIKESSSNKKSRRYVMGKAGPWASHSDSHGGRCLPVSPGWLNLELEV